MPRPVLRPGQQVLIVRSWHSDVVPGTRGVINQRIRGGYFVEITTAFGDARGHRSIETRWVFFSRGELSDVESNETADDDYQQGGS